ncbi:MAG TPA: hypothetical protein VLD85_00320 [Anaeromyxobacteraceae bacterium]|nr:hypothetical protein [Anaeromyxobacteraceae bacterium]
MTDEELRVGDLVEVRSAAEILATLDANGRLGGLPFMPEMVRHCGLRFRVSARGDRICNTIDYGGSMRLPDAVVLEDLRCDGGGHGGCEAECRIFWKARWLRKVSGAQGRSGATGSDAARAELERRTAAHSRDPAADAYSCQATELVRASKPLRLIDPRSYLKVLRGGGLPLGRFVRVMSRAVVLETWRKLGRMPKVHVAGPRTAQRAEAALGLQAGDWVRVKSPEEIRLTLSPKGRNRGLWFDREMLAFCGRIFRVRRRVTRIIDERDGRLLPLKSDCIMLEGVVCSGENSLGRWFCPRAIYPYWREAWLTRVGSEEDVEPAGQPGTIETKA